jgi:hypothetical protein
MLHQPLFKGRKAWLLAAMGMTAAASITPAFAAQSSAYAVSADLTTDGSSHVQLAPQLQTSGSITLGQTYDKPASTALLAKTVRLVPKALRGPVLTVLAQRVATDASGISGIDAVNTQGTSSASSGNVALTALPLIIIDPPYPGPVPLDDAANASDTAAEAGSDAVIRPLPPFTRPALQVQFSKLEATANFSQIFPGPTHRSGSTSVGTLTLSGPLVGLKALRFKGDIAPNTVVVDTPTVKITLNAQVIPQNPVCDPGQICPLWRVLETVETQAVQIQLTNAPVQGHHVTGTIVIGDAQAGQ